MMWLNALMLRDWLAQIILCHPHISEDIDWKVYLFGITDHQVHRKRIDLTNEINEIQIPGLDSDEARPGSGDHRAKRPYVEEH
jgi:hypothetical protein